MTSLERVKELFGPTYGEAVKRCYEYIFLNNTRKDESLGYTVPVLNCNEFGIDQERIIMQLIVPIICLKSRILGKNRYVGATMSEAG